MNDDMPKRISVGQVCDQMAGLARTYRLKPLSMWLKMAANEAYLHQLEMDALLDERIGVWDWHVGNNETFTNTVCGAFFGKRADEAVRAGRLETYTDLIHPDDRGHFTAELNQSIKSGASFFSEYRVVIGGALRWLRADGHCMLDQAGRPIRIMGSAIDITREKHAAQAG